MKSENNKNMLFIVYSERNSVFLRAGTKSMLYQIFSSVSKGNPGKPQHSWLETHPGVAAFD